MEFANAKKGIRLLYIAAIFDLLSVILAIVAIGLGATATAVGAGSGLVLVLVGLAFGIVAFIQNLRGLIASGKDEAYFKYALYTVTVGIIFAILSVFIPGETFAMIAQIIDGVLDILTIVFVCLGISKIFTAKGDEVMAKKGPTTSTIFIIAFACAKIIEVVMSVGNVVGTTIGIILAVAAVVLSIVAYIRLFMYLKKASELL